MLDCMWSYIMAGSLDVSFTFSLDFCVIYIRLGFVYFYVWFFDGFFLSTSQGIGWEEHLQNDVYGDMWDIKPYLVNNIKGL